MTVNVIQLFYRVLLVEANFQQVSYQNREFVMNKFFWVWVVLVMLMTSLSTEARRRGKGKSNLVVKKINFLILSIYCIICIFRK